MSDPPRSGQVSDPGRADVFGALLRRAARKELAQAAHLLAYRGSHVHEGVHQGRKAMRRARASLALAASVLGRGAMLIDQELRRILQALSELRDGQALVEVLQRGTTRLPAEHAPLLARAIRVAQARRAELGRAAGGVGASREQLEMIAMLRAAINGLPWARVDSDVVQHGLEQSGEDFMAAAHRVRAKPDDDETWHRWRRRARRLSQQHRLLEDTPLAVDREAEKVFAEQLGAAQDLSLLLAHCGRASPFGRDDRRALAKIAEQVQKANRGLLLARLDVATVEMDPPA